MKVKCEFILPDVSVQHGDRIDTYGLISVSIVYRQWLYRPSHISNWVHRKVPNFVLVQKSQEGIVIAHNLAVLADKYNFMYIKYKLDLNMCVAIKLHSSLLSR